MSPIVVKKKTEVKINECNDQPGSNHCRRMRLVCEQRCRGSCAGVLTCHREGLTVACPHSSVISLQVGGWVGRGRRKGNEV